MLDEYPPPDYYSVEDRYWKLFNKEVPREAERQSKRLLKRIDLFVSRFGYPTEEVLEKVKIDPMFAAHFAKEPRRMGVHEKEAAKWIETLPWVRGFKTLPKSGKNAYKVSSDGNVMQLGTVGGELPGKTLDFKWQTGDTTFYAMHKYTREGGGNQDSQYKEMIELMKRFMHCRTEQICLLVIVDGPYYQEGEARRLDELRHQQRQLEPRSYALPIEDVPNVLMGYGSP